jgi:hypothetical protein
VRPSRASFPATIDGGCCCLWCPDGVVGKHRSGLLAALVGRRAPLDRPRLVVRAADHPDWSRVKCGDGVDAPAEGAPHAAPVGGAWRPGGGRHGERCDASRASSRCQRLVLVWHVGTVSVLVTLASAVGVRLLNWQSVKSLHAAAIR